MSEIPEDIAQAANYAIDRMPDRRDEDLNTSDFWDLVGLEVEKAILAERDRCAKIAEDKAVGYEDEAESAWECSKPIAVRLRAVSQAIRRR